VYVDPKMSREELAKFYAEDYRKIYGGKHSLEAEKKHANNAFDILIDIGDLPHGKTLDIGCSTGILLELINRFADSEVAYGIEPNIEHCEIASRNTVKVFNCNIEDFGTNIKFDIITMLNALEHVYSPTEVLTKINSLLKDDGYVLVSVPNLYNKTINIPVDAFLSNAHLYNFSEFTIRSLFNKCGFKVINIDHITEEMGDKLYVLGQKHNGQHASFCAKEENPRQHLLNAQHVFEMKMMIQQAGFR
jgi:SAM-dependent methyltransferase